MQNSSSSIVYSKFIELCAFKIKYNSNGGRKGSTNVSEEASASHTGHNLHNQALGPMFVELSAELARRRGTDRR